MQKFPYFVVLDNIRSALNVGAIFRTCDAAGVQKLYLNGITPYPPHNKIPKTALGAIDTVDWERNPDSVSHVRSLQVSGVKIVAVEQSDRSIPFHHYDFEPNTALVFGHEIHGVDPKIIEVADAVVDLPMFGNKESLNVATTVGILCYHLSLKFDDQPA